MEKAKCNLCKPVRVFEGHTKKQVEWNLESHVQAKHKDHKKIKTKARRT